MDPIQRGRDQDSGISPNPHRMFLRSPYISFYLAGTLPDNIYIYIYIYIYIKNLIVLLRERGREREREGLRNVLT